MLHAALKVETTDDCIEWSGTFHKTGYGIVSLNRKVAAEMSLSRVQFAHRASYIQNVGKIPEGLVVRHKCHNVRCINPRHLVTGTQAQNIMDSIIAGRIRTKLSTEQVEAIRISTGSQREVAKAFGVSPTTVWHIRNGTKGGSRIATSSIQTKTSN